MASKTSVEKKPTPEPPRMVSAIVTASETPNGPGREPATRPANGMSEVLLDYMRQLKHKDVRV